MLRDIVQVMLETMLLLFILLKFDCPQSINLKENSKDEQRVKQQTLNQALSTMEIANSCRQQK